MRSLWKVVSRSKAEEPAESADAKETQYNTSVQTQTEDPVKTHVSSQTMVTEKANVALQTKGTDGDFKELHIIKESIEALHADVKRLEVFCKQNISSYRARTDHLYKKIIEKMEFREKRTVELMELFADNLDTLSRDCERFINPRRPPTPPPPFVPSDLKRVSGPPLAQQGMLCSLSVNDEVSAKGPLGNWRPAVIESIQCDNDGEVVESVNIRFLDGEEASGLDLTASLWGNRIATHLRRPC